MTDRTVIGLPVPAPTEDYVSRERLAKMMGVSTKTIDRWRKDGMPYETWGLQRVVFLPSQAIAWRRGQMRRAA